MYDFQNSPHCIYPELEFIKIDEMMILCPLHAPCRECEKFTIIQDVDTDSKFYK
jgi:hypothetical protein